MKFKKGDKIKIRLLSNYEFNFNENLKLFYDNSYIEYMSQKKIYLNKILEIKDILNPYKYILIYQIVDDEFDMDFFDIAELKKINTLSNKIKVLKILKG
jgi:hypothetical protein